MSVELPPLPPPRSRSVTTHGWGAITVSGYEGDQMRAYARAAVDAALEAAAVKCDLIYADEQKESECYGFAQECAAAIRAMRSGVEHI